MRKGFTLIELLVTIGVLAVVAAGVLAAIDPTDKLRAANDGRVQSDLGQVATALNTYAAANDGKFPDAANWTTLELRLSTELGPIPDAPNGYPTYGVTSTNTTAVVYGALLSKKYTGAGASSKCPVGNPYAWWMWNKSGPTTGTGVACGACTTGVAVAPPAAATCGTW